jgi:endonuclease/exonuclease/phosphatase family metal-dependent hydrolase
MLLAHHSHELGGWQDASCDSGVWNAQAGGDDHFCADIALAEGGRMWATGVVMYEWKLRVWALSVISGLLMLSACRDKPHFAWEMDAEPPEPVAVEPVAAPSTEAVSGLRFISHNVENWLVMERRVDGGGRSDADKPEEEKQALITMIARHEPQVFGISEIGTRDDLADVRVRLKAAGVDLPHMHHHQGSDPVRALGLLSKYPITSVSTDAATDFRLSGRNFRMLRGILDATVTAPDGREFRFLGVHLKSKREVSHYDQAQFRLQEAHRLREHVDGILQADPDARLVVFGDLNDTRRSHTVTTIGGAHGSGRQLIPVPARDSNRQMWTHHWRYQDVYSRIDYIFISQSLRAEADLEGSRVIDDAEWRKASDHRPLLLDFPPRG